MPRKKKEEVYKITYHGQVVSGEQEIANLREAISLLADSHASVYATLLKTEGEAVDLPTEELESYMLGEMDTYFQNNPFWEGHEAT